VFLTPKNVFWKEIDDEENFNFDVGSWLSICS